MSAQTDVGIVGSGFMGLTYAETTSKYNKRSRLVAIAGGRRVVLLLLIAVFGPLIAPQDPYKHDRDNLKAPPSRQHFFGTDQLGRDYFSRILAAARTALFVGATVTFLSGIIGILLGSAAGFFGGVTDLIISRALDLAQAFPKLLLASLVNAMAKPPFQNALAWIVATVGLKSLTDTIMVDTVVVLSALALTPLDRVWPFRSGSDLESSGDRLRRGCSGYRRLALAHYPAPPGPQFLGAYHYRCNRWFRRGYASGILVELSGHWHSTSRIKLGANDQRESRSVALFATPGCCTWHRPGNRRAGVQPAGRWPKRCPRSTSLELDDQP